MSLLEKAQQFIDSLPAHQKPTHHSSDSFYNEMGYVHLRWYNKTDMAMVELDFRPEGIEWAWLGPELTDWEGTDFGYDEELPPEFYARLNELFPEPK